MMSNIILKWTRIHGIGMLLTIIPLVLFNNLAIQLIFVSLSFLTLFYFNRNLLKSHKPYGGYANIITGTRLIILLAVGIFRKYPSNEIIIILLVFTLILDGFDGYFARKYGTSSDFGAHFDMETDAFFISLLCSIIYSRSLLPVWILIPGFMRYAYVVFISIKGWSNISEPKSQHARVIAIIVFISLFTPLFLDKSIYLPLTAGATVLLIFSFMVSFILLRRKVLNQ